MSELTLVRVEIGENDTSLYLVDQDGVEIAEVAYDDHLEDVMENVASAICERVGIKYIGLDGLE